MSTSKPRRLFRLPFTRPNPADVDDEFEFHLAMRARELERQGVPADRARAHALAEFGDIDDARRFCRAQDAERMRAYRWRLWLDNLRQDLTYSARGLRRHRGFAASALLTLSVAIALATTAYGIVHAFLVRPLPYPDADRLVRLVPEARGGDLPDPQVFLRIDWSVADRGFAATASWNPDGFTIEDLDRTESVRGAWVSPAYFTMLGHRPAVGRAFQPDEHVEGGPAVILSDALWARLFGRDSTILGRSIRVLSLEEPDRAEVVTVVGIMPKDAWHVDRFTELLRPLPRGSHFPMMARLAPGMALDQAEEQLNAAVLPQMGQSGSTLRWTLVGVQAQYTERVRPTLVALMGGALFLLLIAGANVAGAQTARAAARRAEIQVRLALGASRRRVVLQLLVENLVIAGVAGAIGGSIAALILASAGGMVGERLGTGIPGGGDRLALEPVLLLLVVGAGVLIGATFSLLPALVLTRGGSGSRPEGVAGQRGTARSSASPFLRRGLIVAQVAFTVMLLVGAGLMGRTILAIATTPLGFEGDNVLKGDLFLPGNRYGDGEAIAGIVERLLTRTGATPGARATAAAFPDPLQTFTLAPVRISTDLGSQSPAGERQAAPYVVTPGYFEVLGIPLRAGRDFSGQDAAAADPVAIVSEDLAGALWPGESAVGQRFRTSGDSTWRTVVGVAAETRQPVETNPRGEVYVPFAQRPVGIVFLLARIAGDPIQAIPGLQRAVSQEDDALGLANVLPLAELADRATQRHHALAWVLSLFAALALALAMLGLYASLAYVVAQRRREIAIRVAVGADTWSVRGLVAREGGVLVAAGLLVGITLSIWLTRLLESQLYAVEPTDLVTFAGIVSLLGTAALVAAVAPLRQAAEVDPMEVLRAE